MIITCSKIFKDYPFAHRQHNHDGHCKLIHGHNWTFEFMFECEKLDTNGFVIDFGKLKFIKNFLIENFDHTLLLNKKDPELNFLMDNLKNFSKIVVVENCGAEGLAKFLYFEIQKLIEKNVKDSSERKVKIKKVTVYEDSKNFATVEQ